MNGERVSVDYKLVHHVCSSPGWTDARCFADIGMISVPPL